MVVTQYGNYIGQGKSTAFPERAKKQLAEIMHLVIRNQIFYSLLPLKLLLFLSSFFLEF